MPSEDQRANSAFRELFTCEVSRVWTAHSYATIGEWSYSPKSRYQNPHRFMRRGVWVVSVSRLWCVGTMPAPGSPVHPGRLWLPRTFGRLCSATLALPGVALLPARPRPGRSARIWACGTFLLETLPLPYSEHPLPAG